MQKQQQIKSRIFKYVQQNIKIYNQKSAAQNCTYSVRMMDGKTT